MPLASHEQMVVMFDVSGPPLMFNAGLRAEFCASVVISELMPYVPGSSPSPLPAYVDRFVLIAVIAQGETNVPGFESDPVVEMKKSGVNPKLGGIRRIGRRANLH